MKHHAHDEADRIQKQTEKRADHAEIVIPETVKDVGSYKRYIALKEAPALKLPVRLIETSDPNVTVDPVAHNVAIEKKICDLPSDEQDEIMKRVRAIKVLHFRIGALKEKAFGIKKRKRHSSLVMGLLDERASELQEYFGRLLTDTEVHKIVTTEWGYDVSLDSIRKFRQRNSKVIEKLKDDFIKDHSHLRLSHKRGRLEELQAMYLDRKQKYDDTGGREDYKLLLATLKEIRSETQDNTLRIDANINANINVSIQNHIEEEIMKRLTINDIILARAAHKMKINPNFLISRLHNSFYAKHSGFVEPDGDLKDQEIQYPSMMVYNWKDIKTQHDKHGDKNVEDAEWEEVPPEKKEEGNDIKSALLTKIKQKKEDLNRAQDRVNQNTPQKPQ